MPKILRIFVFTFAFTCTCLAFSGDKKKDDFWLPMEERIKIWDAVVSEQLSVAQPAVPQSLPLPIPIPASESLPLPVPASKPSPKPYTVSANGLEATFEKDGAKWTIVGANAPIVNPTVYPKDWPVKGNDFEVLVIPEPITNYKILPFTEKIENAVKSDTISITAAPDSYEPASFVIRSGDLDLKDVMIEVTDLKAKVKGKDEKTRTAVIPKENIDIRVVKCWYQAGVELHDTKHKTLKPELLLHDDDIVRVDYVHQLNLLRNYEKIEDTDKLKPFNVPKNQNKQMWLTVHITKQLSPGDYQGIVRVIENDKKRKDLKFRLQVLPFVLPEPMIGYALYYEGYLSGQEIPKVEARQKTRQQMLYDLNDMKEHGLTNATLWHEVSSDPKKWDEDWKQLKKTLDLRREIGWGKKPLLYLDWKTRFKEDLNLYGQKVKSIISIACSYGIREVYIYGLDEKRGSDLLALRPIYKAVHEAGAKNFVACTPDFLLYVPDLLDLPILWGEQNSFFMNLLNKLGIKAWRYSHPQAGLEDPETYRRNYGIGLLANGFSGACDYQYQRGAWNDFADRNGRMHTMAYPTVSKPLPTIQWEGWREGVDDIKYLTLLKNMNILHEDWLKAKCFEDISNCRKSAIKILSNHDRK